MKAGNSGSGSGRLETLIIGAAADNGSSSWLPQVDFFTVPLEDGVHFSTPINIGNYNKDFTYDSEPLSMINYLGFYNTNKPLYYYDMYPGEDENIREQRYTEYLQ